MDRHDRDEGYDAWMDTGAERLAEETRSRLAAGAKSSGGKSGSSANVAKDTLFTTATIRLVDLIGEGEIVGVHGGLKGVYLNDTPILNEDGTSNFKGITVDFREGTPDQSYMPGFSDVETPQDVGIQVKKAVPVTASISNPDANRVRVTLQVPALFVTTGKGEVKAWGIDYRIIARYSGGPWVNMTGDQQLKGKASSPFFPSHEFELPTNPAGTSPPWQIQVVRLSDDAETTNQADPSQQFASDLYFNSVTSIVDAKFNYPHSAYVGISADAASFGSTLPTRQYLVDGIKMRVPVNYDPATRAYTGIWNGTFKEAQSDNPAWVLYMLLENDRFGLGEFIDASAIDKWSLYQIAAYCDQLVPDGRGGMEPRLTFNGVIAEQQDAFDLLELVSQGFRGMTYWSSGSVTATQDRPGDPVMLVTEANVIDGEFSYASSSRTARHTVAIVSWSDPSNLYKQEFEVVADDEGIHRYGYNPTKIDLLGCTSRGQAHRAGKWTLLTELQETQVVTYKAGLDHAVVRPGDLIAIQDPTIADIDLSGRLLADSTTTSLHLDRPVTINGGTISVMMPDGTVGTVNVGAVSGSDRLPLAKALPQAPAPAAVWVIATDVKPQLFRVISIREEEPHIYAVTALEHEPGKFATIDQGAPFEELPISEFPKTVDAPTNLKVLESVYYELGLPKQALTLSWTAGQPFNTVGYYVTAIKPDGAMIALPLRSSASADFTDAASGDWVFFVTAAGITGITSDATRLDYTVKGWAGQNVATVTNLQVKGGGSVFTGRSCTLNWDYAFPEGRTAYPIKAVVYVFDPVSTAVLHVEVLATDQREFTYAYDVNVNEGGPRRSFRVGVAALDPEGRQGTLSTLLVSNPAPAVVPLSLESANGIIVASYIRPDDKDLEGGLFWQSETSGFNPLTTPPAYDGPNPTAILTGVEGKRYYIRVAAYDAFSKDPNQLNISAEQSITLRVSIIDVTAPEIPAAPTFDAPTIVKDATGRLSVTVTARWPLSTSSNFGSYESRARINSNEESAWVYYPLGSEPSQTFTGLPLNSKLDLQVRAVNASGFAISGYSPTGSITTPASTTPPGPVTSLTAQGAFQNAFLAWVNPADTDLAYVEIYASDSSDIATANRVAIVAAPGTTWQDTTLSANGSRYYWARSFNTSKLGANTVAGPVRAVSALITAGQLAASAIADSLYVRGIEPLPVVTALPAVAGYAGPGTVAFQGRQYSLRNGQWVLAWAGANAQDVIGKLVAGQLDVDSVSTAVLRAGAIKADMLDVRIITADKLAIGLNTGNLIWNSDHQISGYVGSSINNATGTLTTGYDTYWSVSGMRAFYMLCQGREKDSFPYFEYNFPNASGTNTNLLPILGGKTYEFSVYLSVHRMSAVCVLYFIDANGNTIKQTNGQYIGTNYRTGGADDAWRSRQIAKAPPNATQVLLRIVGRTTGEGGNDGSYVFASAPYFGIVPDGTVERQGDDPVAGAVAGVYSAYTPQSRTIISGGQVALNTLTAQAIVAGSMTTDLFTANTIDAKILNVDTLYARVINSGWITADVLQVGNNETLRSVINGGSTTKINGGAIQANTIEVNKLRVGARGISTVGLEFYVERDGSGNLTNVLAWTDGYVLWNDAANSPRADYIPAGRVGFDARYWYVWWDSAVPGQLNAAADNWPDIKNNANTVLMASYYKTTGLSVFYGGTIIDGTKITTRSITANQIAVNSLTADLIQAGTIFTQTVFIGNKGAGGGAINLEGSTSRIFINNWQNTAARVAIGNIQPWVGNDASGLPKMGLMLWNEQNQVILSSGGVPKEALIGFTSTGNVLVNSTGEFQVASWASYTNVPSEGLTLRPYQEAYDIQGARTFNIHGTGSPGEGGIIDFVARTLSGDRITALPGERYEGSAYINCHRCRGEVQIAFWNYRGDLIGLASSGQQQPNNIGGGRYLSNYQRIGVFGLAPAGTEYVELIVRGNTNGQNDPYLMFCKPYLGQTTPNQADLSPWSPGMQGISITGANISTYIQGAIIGTAYITDAAITNAKIGFAAITNAKISNLEVDNAKIAYLTIGNDRIGNGQITSYAIADGNTDGSYSIREAYTEINMRSDGGKFLIMVWQKGSGGRVSLASPGSTAGSLAVKCQYNGSGLFTIADVGVPNTQVYLPGNGGNNWYNPAFSYSFIWAPPGPARFGFQVSAYTSSLENYGMGIFVMELSK